MKHQVSKTRGRAAIMNFQQGYSGDIRGARFFVGSNPNGAGVCLYFGHSQGGRYLVSLFEHREEAYANAEYLNHELFGEPEVKPRFIVEMVPKTPTEYLKEDPHQGYRLVTCTLHTLGSNEYVWQKES